MTPEKSTPEIIPHPNPPEKCPRWKKQLEEKFPRGKCPPEKSPQVYN